MKTCIATISGVAPYSQSRCHETPKLPKESHDAYDERTWREHLHYDANNNVFVPPMSMKQALDGVAKYLGIKVKGKGQKTYGKLFTSGVLVMEPMVLPIKKDDVVCERLFLNADGVRGSNKRVWRRYPVLPTWEGQFSMVVLDDTIEEAIFEQHLREAGQFIGLGRFRPEKGGFYGRFAVKKTKWI